MRSIGVGIRLFFCSSDLIRSAHVPERRSRQTRATNEGGSLALSVALVVICVFRAFRSTD